MNRFVRMGVLVTGLALLGMVPAALYAADVRTLSTGVGSEDRVAQPDYSLLLIFANAKGQLVANVTVEVTDSAGAMVVKTVSGGPWLFVGLKPGEYRVIATLGSRVTGAAVTVPDQGQERVWLAL